MTLSLLSPWSFLVFMVTATILFMHGLWSVDLGASGMLISAQSTPVQARGLAFVRDPADQYHLGLMLATLMYMVLAAAAGWLYFMLSGQRSAHSRSTRTKDSSKSV